MASGGIYDHLGGGFARYSIDARVAGAPLREDALRPGAAGPRLPARLAGHRRGPLPPGARRDHRLRAARPAPPARRLLLGRGRRLPRRPTATTSRASSTPGRPTRSARCSARARRRRRASTGRASPRPATSRAATSSYRPVRGELVRPEPRSSGPAGAVRRPASSRLRPGLDDKVLTEWNGLMLAAAGRGGRRHRRPRRGSTPRWPPASSCSTTCGDADGRWLRSWQADRRPSSGRRRHLAYAADYAALRRRLHPAGRGHRRRPAGSTRPAPWPTR